MPIGENEHTEFKQCTGAKTAKAPEDLWQSISAFANTRGGSVYLGISKSGVNMNLSADELDSLQCEISSSINSKFFNNKPKIQMVTHEGYLEIKVSEAEFYNKPIYIFITCYDRSYFRIKMKFSLLVT